MQLGMAGTRIRQRRLDLGLRQLDLARQIGISASYLNLIEHNRRRIGGKVLLALAEALRVEPETLSEGGQASVVAELSKIAHQPGAPVELGQIEEIATRFSGWAARLMAQDARIAALEQSASALSDQLAHDPVLSEKMHEMLSTVSAIRSTAAILVETPDIDDEWRKRFHSNIDTESRRLAETSAAMAALLDGMGQETDSFATPLEAVARFFESRHLHIAEIETGGAEAIEPLLKAGPELNTDPVRDLARQMLEDYAKDARQVDLTALAKAAKQNGFDPGALAQIFDVALPVMMRRLACLPAAPDIPDIGLVTCDSAGAILLRKAPLGFSLPKFGAACPLWPLFSALGAPGQPIRRLVRSAQDQLYQAYAICTPLRAAQFDQPVSYRSSMVLIGVNEATEPPLDLGPSCRVCPHSSCLSRREPSILLQT